MNSANSSLAISKIKANSVPMPGRLSARSLRRRCTKSGKFVEFITRGHSRRSTDASTRSFSNNSSKFFFGGAVTTDEDGTGKGGSHRVSLVIALYQYSLPCLALVCWVHPDGREDEDDDEASGTLRLSATRATATAAGGSSQRLSPVPA